MALSLSFSAQVGPGLIEALKPDRLAAAMVDGMNRAVLIVKRRAQLNLTGRFLKVRTGRLRSSVTTRLERRGPDLVGLVGTNVFYGRIHEFGVAHRWPITARKGKALKFTIGGTLFFRRQVVHSGLKERPWLRTALDESRQDIEQTFVASFMRALKGQSGGG